MKKIGKCHKKNGKHVRQPQKWQERPLASNFWLI